MASEEEIIWAYRLFYGREPESAAAITTKLGFSRQQLVEAILQSSEFKTAHLSSTVPDVWLWHECCGGFLRINLRDEHISRRIVEAEYELEETAFIKSIVKNGDRVADLGANIGYYSLLMANLVGPQGKVNSFEPEPTLFHSLESMVIFNQISDRISLVRSAVSDVNGTSMLHPPPDKCNWGQHYIRSDQNSLAEESANTVTTVTLDSVMGDASLDFMKMDVEGAEFLALRGATNILTESRPTILMEINREMLATVSQVSATDCFDLIGSFGYRIHGLGRDGALTKAPLSETDVGMISNVVLVHSSRT